MNKIRVFLAEGYAGLRTGLRSLLESYPAGSEILVVGEAKDGLETLQQVDQMRPDILVMDLKLPLVDGLEVAHRLCEIHSPVHILLLSIDPIKEEVLEGVFDRSINHLTYGEVMEQLLPVVRSLARAEL